MASLEKSDADMIRELLDLGFKQKEITHLLSLRKTHEADKLFKQNQIEGHWRFIRWLVDTGRLTR